MNKNKWDWKNGFILALIVGLILFVMGIVYNEYNQYEDNENLKS